MVILFEFLGNEPIENIITCLHFKIDEVIFWGYHDAIHKWRECTENFLKEHCGVQQVAFLELPQDDLQWILKRMRSEIQKKRNEGSSVYFDITGGESLLLVAFGMLSQEFNAPMHLFDIAEDKLVELDEGAESSISKDVEVRKVTLNLESYIEMYGGKINWGLNKSLKEDSDKEFIDDISKIWYVAKKHMEYWNAFSTFLRANMQPDDNLCVSRSGIEVQDALSKSNSRLKTAKKLNNIVDDLAAVGALINVEHSNGKYRLRFKNQNVKDCLWDGGSILELHTFFKQKEISDDCKIGVHIDWDGIIHPQPGVDVLNEIDVLSLKGNIPIFISCKSGTMGAQQALHALYELDAVAKRFGGKYSKKVLVTANPLVGVYQKRASEMGIEVRQVM